MRIFLAVIVMISTYMLQAQEQLEVEGAISMANSNSDCPAPGTIRWTGTDFEGWNGLVWLSLTGNRIIGNIQDVDGNEYRTFEIGQQVWMVDNLRTSKYNDEMDIDHVTDPAAWSGLSEGAWCNHGNNISNDDIYGKLYNWYTVNSGKLCPVGWKVPTNADYEELVNLFGGPGFAGGKLKQKGNDLWALPNEGATNESGFTALPAGNVAVGSFNGLGNDVTFWTSSANPVDATSALVLYMLHTSDNAGHQSRLRTQGFSVRCIKQ